MCADEVDDFLAEANALHDELDELDTRAIALPDDAFDERARLLTRRREIEQRLGEVRRKARAKLIGTGQG